jgi:hypothetical protein
MGLIKKLPAIKLWLRMDGRHPGGIKNISAGKKKAPFKNGALRIS